MRLRRAIALPVLFGAAVWAQGDPFAFIPDGGRGLLVRALPDPDARATALSEAHDVPGWQTALAGSGLSEREIVTLATYLQHVAPLDQKSPEENLPPDGRDLALAQCQSCHSLFSGYLMQRRDRNGWLVIFASPFHKDIPMSQAEREIFADYSAINMPMRLQDVPPELRF
jgi:hypothetical protein